jgi:O-antigen/teichoic acid export membrane protein
VLGVLTTEATANSHVYIVTALFGPAAFAPVAASALMLRPINVAMNALTEFERAQMAREVGGGRLDLAMAAVRFFRMAMIGAWIVTVGAVAVLLRVSPHDVFPSRYPLEFLVIGAALWMLVAGVRLLRAPESTLLQAAGQFRNLALASVISSVFSVAAVLILLFTAGVLWSICGILVGETMYCLWIHRECRRWLRREAQAAPAMVPVI